MNIHFDWTITFGQMVHATIVCGCMLWIAPVMEKRIVKRLMQHLKEIETGKTADGQAVSPT